MLLKPFTGREYLRSVTAADIPITQVLSAASWAHLLTPYATIQSMVSLVVAEMCATVLLIVVFQFGKLGHNILTASCYLYIITAERAMRGAPQVVDCTLPHDDTVPSEHLVLLFILSVAGVVMEKLPTVQVDFDIFQYITVRGWIWKENAISSRWHRTGGRWVAGTNRFLYFREPVFPGGVYHRVLWYDAESEHGDIVTLIDEGKYQVMAGDPFPKSGSSLHAGQSLSPSLETVSHTTTAGLLCDSMHKLVRYRNNEPTKAPAPTCIDSSTRNIRCAKRRR